MHRLIIANQSAAPPGPYITSASDYDGTNDYQTRGANLTGIVDGKQGIYSGWMRLDGGDSTSMIIMGGGPDITLGQGIYVYRSGSNLINIWGRSPISVHIMTLRTTVPYLAGASWIHILASWDLTDTAKRHLYINDVSDLNPAVWTNDTIDYTTGDFAIGAETGGGFKFIGCLSEQFFHNTYFDLSVESNRRKFISATGKPVNLGADGSTPLGVQPLLYVPDGDGSGTGNKGSGGAFTTTGSLAACSSSPSD